MKPRLSHYRKPTPWPKRKLGDTLLAVGGVGGVLLTSLTTIFGTQSKIPAIVGAILSLLGIFGKFYTNFYSDSNL